VAFSCAEAGCCPAAGCSSLLQAPSSAARQTSPTPIRFHFTIRPPACLSLLLRSMDEANGQTVAASTTKFDLHYVVALVLYCRLDCRQRHLALIVSDLHRSFGEIHSSCSACFLHRSFNGLDTMSARHALNFQYYALHGKTLPISLIC